jgi:signal transduction histidine kinase
MLFAAFARVNISQAKAQEGTGLGLHLSQKLAQLLGGKITFASEYGKGSTFTFSLPEK